jgi:hypothetical protein
MELELSGSDGGWMHAADATSAEQRKRLTQTVRIAA